MIDKAGEPLKQHKKEAEGGESTASSDKFSDGVYGDFDKEIENENKKLNSKENSYSGQESKARDS